MAVRKTEDLAQYSLLTFSQDKGSGSLTAHIYAPPNAARRDWEFDKESYVEALTTVLNSLAKNGWTLASTESRGDDQTIYVLGK